MSIVILSMGAANEDRSRVRKNHASENLAVLRHISLNLLKKEKTAKSSIHTKQLKVALKDDYLFKAPPLAIKMHLLRNE